MDSHSTHEISITIDAPGWAHAVADPERLCRLAVEATLRRAGAAATRDRTGPGSRGRVTEVSLLLADDAGVRALNRDWRGKDHPTNVLSFPGEDSPERLPPDAPWLLGDVVLALETVLREAQAASLPAAQHLAHLVVHGVLHLLGHDHEEEEQALAMESLETAILAGLGVPDPHADRPPPVVSGGIGMALVASGRP